MCSKQVNGFCCKLTQVAIKGDKTINFWGHDTGGQRSRSQDAKIKSGGLAGALFSTSSVEGFSP